MNGDPGWFLTEVHRHQRDGAAPVPTDTTATGRVRTRCGLQSNKGEVKAGEPVPVGTVQIQPHSFTASDAGRRFHLQNLWTHEPLVEKRQPVILREERWR